MEPRSHEEHIRHTFDAFCKKALRNEARDYLDELARRRSREISFSELPVEVMEQLSVCDDYFAEDRTFDVLGYRPDRQRRAGRSDYILASREAQHYPAFIFP